ncbi:MAG: hypothetical protein HKN47_25755 [Pirellulaceae bacterium]|nr:hypothetical protein [Pirellulaceae bacterium]
MIASYKGMTAEQFLESVFARYRSAESYRDQARVRLSLRHNGRVVNELAPLSVWFDRNSLYVEAYDVRLRSHPSGRTAWIKDSTTRDFDSQVVRLPPLDGRPPIDQLLTDAVLNDRIAAGLAGPPPQLEWLFAETPMAGLFDGKQKIAFGRRREIEDRPCLAVHVVADQEHYRFWIDQTEGVIRRVDLPSILVPMQHQTISGDSVAESMLLTLELRQATFQSPNTQPSLAELPARPKFVDQFVPLPPAQPAANLGTTPGEFATRDQTGQIRLSNRGSDREVTVLVFALGNSSAVHASTLLTRWVGMMTSELRTRLRVALVSDEAGFRQVPRQNTIPIFIDQHAEVLTAMGAAEGDVIILNRNGTIQWVQSGLNSESLTQIGLIVGDVLDGIDVPTRARQQWRSDQLTYESILSAALARHVARQSQR